MGIFSEEEGESLYCKGAHDNEERGKETRLPGPPKLIVLFRNPAIIINKRQWSLCRVHPNACIGKI